MQWDMAIMIAAKRNAWILKRWLTLLNQMSSRIKINIYTYLAEGEYHEKEYYYYRS